MNFLKKWQLQKRRNSGSLPEFMVEYYDTFLNATNLKKIAIENIRFVVLDTETTGLDIKEDFVLSIGAVTVKQKAINVQESIEKILNVKQKLEEETVQIHGLTLEDIANGQTKEAVVEEFISFLGNSVIIAHHAAFDVAMLNKTISEAIHQPFKLENLAIDTAYLARRLDKADNPYYAINDGYGLDSLCRKYNIAMHDRHTAWGDAFITAELFVKLMRNLENRGIKTLGDLMMRIPEKSSF